MHSEAAREQWENDNKPLVDPTCLPFAVSNSYVAVIGLLAYVIDGVGDE